MNQAVVDSQHSQQQQQQHHSIENGRINSSSGIVNNNNNHQNGHGLTLMSNIGKAVQAGQAVILGPKIWDKTMRLDDYDDVKLEYMDLEEFLVENELPMDTVFAEQQNIDDEQRKKQQQQQQHNSHQHMHQQDQFHRSNSTSSESHQPQQLQAPEQLAASIQQQLHQHQTNAQQQQTNNSSCHQQQQHQQQQPSHHSSNHLVTSSQQPPSSARDSVGTSPICRSSMNTAIAAQSTISSPPTTVPSIGNCPRGVSTNGTTSSNDRLQEIAIKTEGREPVPSSSSNPRLDSGVYEVPGEETLSLPTASRTPRSTGDISPEIDSLGDEMHTYSFGADEVKPPRGLMHDPHIGSSGSNRKKRKLSIMEDSKDDRYWERRRKNNMAAKRSRDARRAKENQIAMKATFFERENKVLTQELGKARAEIHLLRERLCKYEIV